LPHLIDQDTRASLSRNGEQPCQCHSVGELHDALVNSNSGEEKECWKSERAVCCLNVNVNVNLNLNACVSDGYGRK
jgi:hypothetical protein